MHFCKCPAYLPLPGQFFVSISAFVKEIFQVKLTGAIHPNSMKCENSRKDGAKLKSYLIVFSYHTTCRSNRIIGKYLFHI